MSRVQPAAADPERTQISVLPAAALGDEHLARWDELQRAQPALGSPFFRPEFTRAVASVRGNVEVALLRDGGRVVGFFPFERGPVGLGRPVGGRLSDYHGVVAEPDARWDGAALVRACGLRAWTFTHVPVEQRPLARFAAAETTSPYLHLGSGYDAYERERKAAGTNVLSQVARAGRRLAEAHGPVTFAAHEPDVATLHRLLELKSAQYDRTGQVDIFAARSHGAVFERMLAEQGDELAGVLSTLRAGGRLVAAHFGMRTPRVWHYWVPAYDPAFSRFKPGLLLLLEMARHAAGTGIEVLDLGRGDESYKGRLASGSFGIAEGVVGRSRIVALQQALRERARVAAQRSPALASALRATQSLKLRFDERAGR